MSKKGKKMTKKKARKYLKLMENMKLNGTYITKKTDDFKFEPIDDIYTPIDFFYDSNLDHLALNLNGLEKDRCSTSLNSRCEITTIIPVPSIPMNCPYCNTTLEGNEKYCHWCGSLLLEEVKEK